MNPGHRIDYKALREVDPATARLAVLEYLKTNDHNISDAARVFGINRSVVYDVLKKEAEGDLTDRSRVPKRQPNKTPPEIEQKVIEAKNKTRLGPKRLSLYVSKCEELRVPGGTIRHILRRNKHRLTYPRGRTRRGKRKREFVDWYSAKCFEVVQVDVKYIRDQKALTKQEIIHLDRCDIPNYHWGALDVNSRFKLIAYSRERSWTNGLCFYLWVISWLRSHGVTVEIVFTVDNGEEFGGKSWLKVKELRKSSPASAVASFRTTRATPRRTPIWNVGISLTTGSSINSECCPFIPSKIFLTRPPATSMTTATSGNTHPSTISPPSPTSSSRCPISMITFAIWGPSCSMKSPLPLGPGVGTMSWHSTSSPRSSVRTSITGIREEFSAARAALERAEIQDEF